MKTLHKFEFNINRDEANFDRACDSARQYALTNLKVDENGYITAIEDSDRSSDYISITFVSLTMCGGMGGWNYCYSFKCSVERS